MSRFDKDHLPLQTPNIHHEHGIGCKSNKWTQIFHGRSPRAVSFRTQKFNVPSREDMGLIGWPTLSLAKHWYFTRIPKRRPLKSKMLRVIWQFWFIFWWKTGVFTMHAFRKCLESIFIFFGQSGQRTIVFYVKNRLLDGDLLISKILDRKGHFKNFLLWFSTNFGHFWQVGDRHNDTISWANTVARRYPHSFSLFVMQEEYSW